MEAIRADALRRQAALCSADAKRQYETYSVGKSEECHFSTWRAWIGYWENNRAFELRYSRMDKAMASLTSTIKWVLKIYNDEACYSSGIWWTIMDKCSEVIEALDSITITRAHVILSTADFIIQAIGANDADMDAGRLEAQYADSREQGAQVP